MSTKCQACDRDISRFFLMPFCTPCARKICKNLDESRKMYRNGLGALIKERAKIPA